MTNNLETRTAGTTRSHLKPPATTWSRPWLPKAEVGPGEEADFPHSRPELKRAGEEADFSEPDGAGAARSLIRRG